MNKVSVFGIGVQKCATTTLFQYMAEHPELASPIKKEMHFFDNEEMDWAFPQYEELENGFSNDTSDGTMIRFEFTPIYIFWPQCLERIFTYNPDAKLIAIFRDPFDRAWSQWCMEFSQKREKWLFSEALRNFEARTQKLGAHAPERRVYSYIERGFYGRQVEKLMTIFPKDQTLFLLMGELQANPEEQLKKISSFLGISNFSFSEPVHRHRRVRMQYPCEPTLSDLKYVQERLARDLEKFQEITGLDIRSWKTFQKV